MILASNGILASSISGISLDADYLAFYNRVIAAGGSLTSTEQTATNQLVLDLKANSIWTAMKAIYPMVGASAAACAQNLKSSSFTGSFTSGWTFASTGATPNGSAYMDCNYQPSVSSQLNSSHISYYSRTNTTNTTWTEMGCGVANNETYILYEYQNLSYISNNSTALAATPNITSPNGLFINTRSSSSVVKRFHKNVSASYTLNSTSLTSKNMYVGAHNGPSSILYTQRQCAFASIGNGLTDTEASNFYTVVQAFQTTLSRQV